MKQTGTLVAAAMMLATLVGTSAFADSRRQEETWRDDSPRRGEADRNYRDNERVTVQGQIRNVMRERDGYRVGYRDHSYRDDVVRGVVERIGYRRGILILRDEHDGRRITVDMIRVDRRGRGVDFDDLRRGDRVTLSGDWSRRGVFEAYRVESVRSRRW